MVRAPILLRSLVPAAFVLFAAAAVVVQSVVPVHTHAFRPWPPWDRSRFRSGALMKDWEVSLQESSWLAAEVRGIYAESAWRMGVLDSAEVARGRDDWMFLRATLRHDWRRFEAAAPRRRAFLQALHARCERLGVRVLAVLVPDKVRLYPDKLYPDGQLPVGKQPLYQAGVDELRAAGIEVLEALTVLRRLQEERPGEPLYHPRDSHWKVDAATHVALAVDARLDQSGWTGLLGPDVAYHPSPMMSEQVTGDLGQLLGFRPDSSLARELSDQHRWFFLLLPDESPFEPDQPAARLALCGTSFSDVHLKMAIAAATGKLMDHSGVIPGGGPFAGLSAVLDAVERGDKAARVIVWEFAERMLLDEWLRPPAW